jgi:uncharacterized membrane protein
MPEPTPYLLSQHFGHLIGRKVTFVQTASETDSKARPIYGVYTVFPRETPLVVKADLALLGSFAGALVGLPDSEVSHRLSGVNMEELLRDAICEVFNVASAVVAVEGRAVFDAMITDRTCISGAAEQILMKPFRRSHFNVTVEGYQSGRFNVFSDLR